MSGLFAHFLHDGAGDLRRRILTIFALLIAANIGVWVWAFAVLGDNPVLLGTALLAYTFGLRHAVDADHIAAIDNVTRKLMHEGKRPVAAGFFFSIGHATIVIGMTIGIAFAAAAVQNGVAAFREIGGVISTCVSAFFLFTIAALNIIILVSVYRTFQAVKSGKPFVEEDLDMLLNNRGLLARLFRPLFGMVTRSWHLLPVGLLFGLGFDTATEVALFGISATQATQGMSWWVVLVFPALFTAGMSLIDTADSILMLGAYGWAFMKPIRKLYYNLTITFVSVVVAVLIGGIETLALLADKLALHGPFWDIVGDLSENFGTLGYIIIGLFVVSWLISIAYYRFRRLDELEVRLASRAGRHDFRRVRRLASLRRETAV